MSGIFSSFFSTNFGNIVNPLAGGTASQIVIDPNDATPSLVFNSSGLITGELITQSWYLGSPDQTYEVRATLQSGSTPSAGTMNSWLALNINRTWTNSQTTPGTRTSTILFEIRRQSDSVVVTSGTYTITAVVEV